MYDIQAAETEQISWLQQSRRLFPGAYAVHARRERRILSLYQDSGCPSPEKALGETSGGVGRSPVEHDTWEFTDEPRLSGGVGTPAYRVSSPGRRGATV